MKSHQIVFLAFVVAIVCGVAYAVNEALAAVHNLTF